MGLLCFQDFFGGGGGDATGFAAVVVVVVVAAVAGVNLGSPLYPFSITIFWLM